MRIALCFSGGLRTFKYCYKHVIDKFKSYGEVDLFISTWNKPCYTQVKPLHDIHAIDGQGQAGLLSKDDEVTIQYLNKLTKFKRIQIEDVSIMHKIIQQTKSLKWTIMSPSRLACQYYKMQKCHELKKEYEKLHDFKYDVNVRLRCDIKIDSLPERFDLNKIYINSMVYKNHKVFKNDMINEMIYVCNNENMDIICNIYDMFLKLWTKDGFGERLSYTHFKNEGLIEKSYIHDFKIKVDRGNNNHEIIE